ncbi:hypothetical protein Hamer_G024162 [Homarus americanus]|uniref:Uncharacterized protein n=2 Tax=Homarus americanus TaxID=6706 RepID=A0A8J5JBW3_HOMAM|nr:hypothetical protein Hamer_G024162 [Homarus americanus]
MSKSASPGDLSDAGFSPGGVSKGSVAAGMMSNTAKAGSDMGAVPDLQSAGAKSSNLSQSSTTRGALDTSGFQSGGVAKGSVGAQIMSDSAKSGQGGRLVSTLQSVGAKK